MKNDSDNYPISNKCICILFKCLSHFTGLVWCSDDEIIFYTKGPVQRGRAGATLVAFMLAAFSWPVLQSHTGLQLGKPNGPVLGRRTNRCWRQHRFVQPANAWPEPASRYWQPVLASTGLPKEKSMPKKYICRPVSTYIG